MGDGQPQAGAGTNRFGGMEWLEQPGPLGLGHARPIVFHPDLTGHLIIPEAHADVTARCGLHRVGEQVAEGLLNARAIDGEDRVVCLRGCAHPFNHGVDGCRILPCALNGTGHDTGQPRVPALDGTGTGEVHELAHGLADPFDLTAHVLEPPARLIVEITTPQEPLCFAVEDAQRRAELMGDTGGELAHGRQFA